MDERDIQRISREHHKARKAEYLNDLAELGEYTTLAAEYVRKACEVLIRKTHVLNGDGITDLVEIGAQLQMYAEASTTIANEIKAGKR